MATLQLLIRPRLILPELDRNTPNPFGRANFKKNGEPNGMLLDHAQDLVAKNIPKATQAEREEALLRGIDREIKLGWCEIQNAGSHRGDIDLIRKAFEAGKTKIRSRQRRLRSRPGSQNFLAGKDPTSTLSIIISLSVRSKLLFDGALGSRGAALLKPYSDAPETSGLLREKPAEDLRPIFEEAAAPLHQVETHALGDRANRLILDLYEQAFKAVPADERKIREPRWRHRARSDCRP